MAFSRLRSCSARVNPIRIGDSSSIDFVSCSIRSEEQGNHSICLLRRLFKVENTYHVMFLRLRERETEQREPFSRVWWFGEEKRRIRACLISYQGNAQLLLVFADFFSSGIFMLEWLKHAKGEGTKSEEKEKSSNSMGTNIVTDPSLFGSLRWRLFFPFRLSSFASVFCLLLARFLCSSPPYVRAVHIRCSFRLGKKRKKTPSDSVVIGWSSIEAERLVGSYNWVKCENKTLIFLSRCLSSDKCAENDKRKEIKNKTTWLSEKRERRSAEILSFLLLLLLYFSWSRLEENTPNSLSRQNWFCAWY